MKRTISVSNQHYSVEVPNKCPLCHHHGDFVVQKTHELPDNRGVEVIYVCPFEGCKRFFVGYYGPKPSSAIENLRPHNSEPRQFAETISRLSPQFVSIYQEAEEARNMSLTQICGAGYRKAFEFLIKDYAKSLAPDKQEEIEGSFSGKVVSDFIQDPRIQAVSKRALWLGNDETHYLKKWESHDIEDLLVLIRLSINWIEIERLSSNYTNEMPE